MCVCVRACVRVCMRACTFVSVVNVWVFKCVHALANSMHGFKRVHAVSVVLGLNKIYSFIVIISSTSKLDE